MAYDCSPYHGSEAGMGWRAAREAARYCDTWVICSEKWEPHIRRLRESGGAPAGLWFAFLPDTAWARLAWKLPGAGYLSYNLWQRRALQLARRLHGERAFDLVHHVNIIGYREPGYLWKLGVPFIWGPVGGTQNYPWRFLGEAGLRGGLSEAARNVVNTLQFRLSRRVRRACREAAALLVANSTGQKDFARVHGVDSLLMLETGIAEDLPGSARRGDAGSLRILWCGSLETRKALSLLIKALAGLTGVTFELRVLGRDLSRGRYQKLARRLGVGHRIGWLGQLPHAQALEQYSWADVFVFTSLRDTSGNVVLEAMAAGLPVVCLDHQGVHDMVTEQCGLKIPVTTPADAIRRLRGAIATLAHDPPLRQSLGAGSLKRAREFGWERRGRRMAAVYEQAIRDRRCLWERRP